MIIYALQATSITQFVRNSWADGQFSFSAQQIQLLNEESIRQRFEAEEKPRKLRKC